MTREEYEKKKKEGTLTEKEKRGWEIAEEFDKMFDKPRSNVVIDMSTEAQRKFEEEERNHWYEEMCKKGFKSELEKRKKQIDMNCRDLES